MKKRGDKPYELMWSDRYGFTKLAIQYQAIIIPIACVGIEDMASPLIDIPIHSIYGRYKPLKKTISVEQKKLYQYLQENPTATKPQCLHDVEKILDTSYIPLNKLRQLRLNIPHIHVYDDVILLQKQFLQSPLFTVGNISDDIRINRLQLHNSNTLNIVVNDDTNDKYNLPTRNATLCSSPYHDDSSYVSSVSKNNNNDLVSLQNASIINTTMLPSPSEKKDEETTINEKKDDISPNSTTNNNNNNTNIHYHNSTTPCIPLPPLEPIYPFKQSVTVNGSIQTVDYPVNESVSM